MSEPFFLMILILLVFFIVNILNLFPVKDWTGTEITLTGQADRSEIQN